MSLFNKLKKSKSKTSRFLTEKVEKGVGNKPETTKLISESDSVQTQIKSKKNVISPFVLIRPIITEKATELKKNNKYLFEVSSNSNKIEIKKAIKELYGVWPIKVNIQKVRGKKVHYGRSEGRTKNWKKAIVTLKPGEKIEFVKKA